MAISNPIPNNDLTTLLKLPIGCRVRHHNQRLLGPMYVVAHEWRDSYNGMYAATIVRYDHIEKTTVYKTASLVAVEEEPK